MMDTEKRGLFRYIELSARSLAALWRLRGSTIVVQSPSVVLAGMAVLLAPILRLRVVMDAHNEAVQPFTHDSPFMRWLVRATIQRAYLVIVTNDELAAVVAASGGRSYVLPDAIPTAPTRTAPDSGARVPSALIICTYALDEPLSVYVDTARRLQASVEFRLTGRPDERALSILRNATPNLKVLGYLAHAEYWEELVRSNTVIDLTLKPNCLVCGAYEAIGAGKSPILSEGISNARTFGEIANLVANSPDDLARAVIYAIAHPRPHEVAEFRERYMSDWRDRLAGLARALDEPR